MIALLVAIFKAVSGGISIFSSERALHNRPDMIKNKLDLAKQATKDALNKADAVLADPNATPAQHAEALRQLRIASS